MKCRKCGKEVGFVLTHQRNDLNATYVVATHLPDNCQDRDTFPGAGSRWVKPSKSTQYRLRKELEENCEE